MPTLLRSALVLFALTSLVGCSRWSSFETLSHEDARRAPVASHVEGGQGIAFGTPVTVVLTRSIRSEDDSAEAASFIVLHDVRATDGSVALPAGSPVAVRIDTRGRRRLGRPAEIVVHAVGAYAPDGSLVPLRGEGHVTGVSRRGLAAGMSIGMTLVYWPFSVFHMLHRGGAVEMQSGFVIDAAVTL